MNRSLLRLAGMAAVLVFSACATEKEAQREAVINFNDANMYFAQEKNDSAERYYHKVTEEAPDSPYRAHALLGVADSYYMEGEWIAAEPLYARFIELYPLDDMTPYALFYEGMSYFNDMVPVKKDQTNTKKARDSFVKFVDKYPDHPAAPFAREKIIFLTDRLAEKSFTIAEFYFNIAQYGACIGRVDDLLEKYPDSKYNGKALMMKGRSYAAEEAFEKAKAVFIKVKASYPDFARDAETELKTIEKKL